MKTMIPRTLSVASLLAFAATARAADGDYSGYVSLTRRDSNSSRSWNAAGGWSDGAAPDASKNYYVAPGAILWYGSSSDAADPNRCWNGGQLVIAGTFHSSVSSGDMYAPFVRDLVMLGGSELRLAAYGPLYPYNGETGVVTVAGTAANPTRISQNYPDSGSTATPRNHGLEAKFTGTADSHLVYSRPLTNYDGKATDRGYFCRIKPYAFAGYPGTLRFTGGNTIVAMDATSAFDCPGMALLVDGGAEFRFNYANRLYDTSLRSFSASAATLVFAYDSSRNALSTAIDASEGFSMDGGTVLRMDGAPFSALVPGVSSDNPQGISVKVAHLGAGAAEGLGDLSGVRLLAMNQAELPSSDFRLLAVDDGAGGKDVYVAAPGIVAMTNQNVESTGYPAGSVQYGAFEEGHAGDWTSGETPSADSALHYWATKKLCFFKPVEMPNATLTFAASSSWKMGSSISFKEINILGGVSFLMWGSDAKRLISADRLNVLHAGALASGAAAPAEIALKGKLQLTIDAALHGDTAGLKLASFETVEGQYSSISLSRANTDFHGQVTFSQSLRNTFRTYLGDARNWGGEYTASASTYDAIRLSNFPHVIVTNSVDFAEPTRGMHILGGARLEVQDGRTMRLSNQVTYAGAVEKTGAGILDLAGTSRFIDGSEGTLPVEGTNVLSVAEGALRVSSSAAADGLAVSFAEGTRLIVPADTESGYRNLKWDAPLAVNTADGVLPVEIDDSGVDSANVAVPVCTFSETAAASIPLTTFRVMGTANGLRCKSFAKRSNGDGSVSYVATIGRCGMQVVIR